MLKSNASPEQSTLLPTTKISSHLDELPRRILRSSIVWKTALSENYAAEELDGTAPMGSGMILFALFEHDGWTIGDLAHRSKVTHVAVLHLIHKLESACLVYRQPCPDDGRATRVWLTQRGRDLEPKMRALHLRNLATLTGALGKKDAALLSELLGRLIESLTNPSKSKLP